MKFTNALVALPAATATPTAFADECSPKGIGFFGPARKTTFILAMVGLMGLAANSEAGNGWTASQEASSRASNEQASPVSSDRASGKLPAAARSAISAAIGHDQQAYQAQEAGKDFRLMNRPSNITAVLTPQGAQVVNGKARWGMTLEAYGTSEDLQPVRSARPQARGNRVEYRRGDVVEWYVNGPAGLEQGFSIERKPEGKGGDTLVLSIALSGNLSPRVDEDRHGLALNNADGQTVLSYAGLTAWDATGRELPSWLEASSGRLQVHVNGTGATYPVVVDPYLQTTKLTASDGAALDQLGTSVSVSADGSTAVAGAPADDNYRGSAYVFVKRVAGWDEVAKLTAFHHHTYADLGLSVSVSADGSTVVAGADGDNSAKGSAYVFVRPTGGWADETETAKLIASDRETTDALGTSVSVSADGSTVVAGAIGDDYSRGSAYVFVKPGGGWANGEADVDGNNGNGIQLNEVAKLMASDGRGGTFGGPYGGQDKLGNSVSVSADGSTVVAGEVGDGIAEGSAYVFAEPGGGWDDPSADIDDVTDGIQLNETAKLTASDGAELDTFGTSVSVSADGTTVVAGAPGDDTYRGSAYVFSEPYGGWDDPSADIDDVADGIQLNETAKLTASDGATNDQFGSSVSVSADGSTVVAGAPVDDNHRGSAYVFEEPDGGWAYYEVETAKLTASDGAGGDPADLEGDQLGNSVSVSADGSTVVAGAFGVDTYRGSAYVFEDPAAAWTHYSSAPCATDQWAGYCFPN